MAIEDETPDRREILKWMQKRGLTMTAAAEDLGVSLGFLSHWLRHEVEALPKTWERWSLVTGIPLRAFLEGHLAPDPRQPTDDDSRPAG